MINSQTIAQSTKRRAREIKTPSNFISPWDRKPAAFDLVNLKTHTGRVITGWWDGSGWDGAALEGSDEIIGWTGYTGRDFNS